MRSITSEGPEAKRPPHCALAGFCVSFGLMVLGLATIGATFNDMIRRMKGLLFIAVLVSAGFGSTLSTSLADSGPPIEGQVQNYEAFAEPLDTSDVTVLAKDGSAASLDQFKGKFIVLNFWATWCAPCRAEMPMLEELQVELGGDDFEVVTLATGRNSPAGIVKFFAEAGITTLPRHQDPKQALAREMAVLGLPITVILDREGREIARLQGDAEWNSDSAKAILSALITEQ